MLILKRLNFSLKLKYPAHSTNFQGAKIIGANCFRSDFKDANLKNAKLQNSNMVGANFENADLSNANLKGAVLKLVNLEGANLENAQFNSKTILPFDKSEALERGMIAA